MTPSDFSGPKPSGLPALRDTIIVAAFEGWNDAGDAASDALQHLDSIWEADTLVEIDDEAYYDYQVNRPVIRQVDGVTSVCFSFSVLLMRPCRNNDVGVDLRRSRRGRACTDFS